MPDIRRFLPSLASLTTRVKRLRGQAEMLAYVARWRATWDRHDLDYRVPGLPPERFITAREAAARIPDGATVITSGMAGSQRASIHFFAVRERFKRTGQPRGLTWISVGAQGSRGRVPGTLEELGLPGLLAHVIQGHAETCKAQLKLVDAGQLTLRTLPQGQMVFALDAQGRGVETEPSDVGLGTFLDPRLVPAGRVPGLVPGLNAHPGPLPEPLVELVAGPTPEAARLRYHLPRIDVALVTLPAADAAGNLYARHAAMVTEAREALAAAKRNGGLAIASVAEIVPPDPDHIFVPASGVDFIVVHPYNEQTAGVLQRRYWPMFTTEGGADVDDALARVRFVNRVLGITPRRGPAEDLLARLGAAVFARTARPGALVNFGVGLPEEVGRVLYEQNLHGDVTFSTEVGVMGGVPGPGVFFSTCINPKEIVTSAEGFRRYARELELAIFGLLQVDGAGNVNVSKRGPRALDYVGPGGLPDIACSAKTVLFVGSWMAGARFDIRDGKLRIAKPGKPKFVAAVDEITFSGAEALRHGKRVFYITHVGVFELTARGLMLIEVVPGIDIERDIRGATDLPFVLPDGGPAVIDPAVVTGRGFRLGWPAGVA